MERAKEINITQLLQALLKKWWLIVVCAILFGILAFVYTDNFVTPYYSARVTVYVNNTKESVNTLGVSASDLATSQRLVATYLNILKSNTVLSKVAEAVGSGVQAGQIRGMMTAQSLDDTEVFQVNISNADPYMAAKIANAVADVAPAEIAGIIDGSSTKIIDYADVPVAPYTPNTSRNTAIGIIMGIVLACAIVVLQTLLDVRIKSEEDLAQLSKVPVLGKIPDLTADIKDHYGYVRQEQDEKGEVEK